MEEFLSRYQPRDVEDKWLKRWEEQNLFHAMVDKDKKPFSVSIPPPNVTGILHMGHALNNTLQDIIVRYKRMKGYSVLWMPGTDHAGIATQNVVEKNLAKEGKTRHDISREEFLEKLWDWKKQYGNTIIHQLKKLGSSCDWPRTRFTMDDDYSKAVKTVFVKLFEKGLIYRGQYIINWCPRCHTALSDEEAEHKEHQGALYHIRYFFKDNPNKFVTVATTRPETMLGDTAVAVHPKDKRYQKLIGKTLVLPLVNREITIVADNFVDAQFGTGAVKVTPAHDPNDFEIGKRHHLDFINILTPDGTLNEHAGPFSGLERFEGRKAIIEELRKNHFLEKEESHLHAIGHCYRCDTIVEPYLSKQWFVKMKPLAKPAIDVVKKGRVAFYPDRWTKVYLNWMENIRDWCISRQIWWGHRIPVWYCVSCGEEKYIVAEQRPSQCPHCHGSDFYQDEDVLDTWFSSWLWPFATLHWPKEGPDLKYFYPTDVLFTAPEIIFFWVARMIMAGLEFMGDIPFSHVYLHGTVRDAQGRKMSKSLGNAIDPIEIIDQYGADALRFSLIINSGQDLFISKEKFEVGRNFANKIWNASRFVLMNTTQVHSETLQNDFRAFDYSSSSLMEKWILSKLQGTIKAIEDAVEQYRFSEAESLLYDFIWKNFCDWYLEVAKTQLSQRPTQIIMRYVLEQMLQLAHPFMPFVTEEIWQKTRREESFLSVQSWPEYQRKFINKEIENQVAEITELISAIRNVRAQWQISPSTKIDCILQIENKSLLANIKEHASIISSLAQLNNLVFHEKILHPKETASGISNQIKFYLPLHGIIDIQAEQKRIQEQLDSLKASCQNLSQRIQDKRFLSKAPAEIIQKEKQRLIELTSKMNELKKIKKDLS